MLFFFHLHGFLLVTLTFPQCCFYTDFAMLCSFICSLSIKATITDLLKRRGHLKIDTQRVPLTDNTLIEEHMSDYNMLCVEDIVHELHSVGEYFGQVSTFLWPFRLAAFSSKFQKRVLNMKDGQRGDYGDVGESMDDMIRKVL
mmetsp:Transcript_19407/g.28960  ORF Transcript_19407/g.28960 Transcript_19407/m.28960 type:complete len:143 (+) Transcript_19407:773-1201(+)